MNRRDSWPGRHALRVVQVSTFRDPHGRSPEVLIRAWPSLTRVASAARGAGVDVMVVQAAAQEASIELSDGTRMHFVDEPGPRVGGRLGRAAGPLPRRVAERVASLRPDVIHFHGLSMPRHLRAVARRAPGAEVLAQDHADRPPRRGLRWLHRRGLAAAGAVAFTAREQAEPFVEAGVVDPDMPVFEILEDTSDFAPGDRAEARRVTGISGDPCLVWIGRLDANKDPFTVLEAVGRASDRLPDLRLWCCFGDAPLEDAVRDRVERDPSLRERVHLLGRVPHATVERLLQAADFLVQGSHREGSGYSVIEALACGCTPLVTAIPSFRRITRAEVGGLFPPGDVVGLARLLVERGSADRARLRALARQHFEVHLSPEALGRELREAYTSLLRIRRSA